MYVTGQSGSEEFIHTVFAIVEAVAQHPNILMEYHSLVIDLILPPLAMLVASSSGKPKMSCVIIQSGSINTRQHNKSTNHDTYKVSFSSRVLDPVLSMTCYTICEI